MSPSALARRRRAGRLLEMLLLAAAAAHVVPALAPSPSVPRPRPLTIDLSRAPPATLAYLPGIGEARAHAIVEDRRRHGPVPHLAALERVPGIGPATVQALRDARSVRAVVGGPVASAHGDPAPPSARPRGPPRPAGTRPRGRPRDP